MSRYDVALVAIRLVAVLVLLYGLYVLGAGLLVPILTSFEFRHSWSVIVVSLPLLLLGVIVAAKSRSLARWISRE